MQKKAFDKIHSFIIKTLSKLGIDRNFLNLIKNIFKNPIVNIIFSGEKLDVFPLRSGRRQGCPHSPLLFNIILEVIVNTVRQEREIKEIQIRKEEIKLSLFMDIMII